MLFFSTNTHTNQSTTRQISYRLCLIVASATKHKPLALVDVGMPQIELSEQTLERLDRLRETDEDYDEIITELLNIYEVEELTLFRSGDG